MAIFQWCKTQIMAIMVLAYVEFVFVREEKALNRLTKNPASTRCLTTA